MKKTSRPLRRIALAVLAAACLLLDGREAAARRGGEDGGGGGEDRELTLRVNDAIDQPGGTVAVVLRTYAPRPIRQGQVRVRVVRRPPRAAAGTASLALPAVAEPLRPIATLIGAVVYSQRGDSTSSARLAGGVSDQAVTVQFASPSGTVNAADGPLAVLRLRLDPNLVPGQTFDLQIDPGLTSLIESGGQPVTIDPRGATLTVRAPSAPFLLEAEGDGVEPGETAELGVQSFEPFPVSGGQVALRYDPRFAAGPPAVRMDPRFGRSTFSVVRRRGLLIVTFQSPDKTLNTVPGTFVSVSLPTSASAPPGARSALSLDPSRTWLLSRQGRRLPLAYEAGALVFE